MKTNLLKFVMGILLPVTLVMTSCDDDDPKSSLTGLTSFSFVAHDDIPGLENVEFKIDQTTYTISNEAELPYMTDVSKLIADFEAIENTTVMVGTTEQMSGATENDFSSPVNYVVTAEDGVTQITYQVTVNVSQVNPEGVSWVKEQAAATSDPYETVASVYFNGKYRTIYGSVANNVASSKYMTSTDGASWTEVSVDAATFPVGSHHEMIVYNNKLYICGYLTITDPWGIGYFIPGNLKEIWESEDGETFTKLSTTYTFDGDKIGSALYALDNKLWVVGGNTLGFGNPDGAKPAEAEFAAPAGLSNRIHNTTDMATWDEAETDVLQEEALRRYAATTVHNNKMYMIGGQLKDASLSSDVWSSEDGKTWTLVGTGGFTARMKAAVVSYDNKLWLIGGQTGLGVCTAEMLVSEDDGVTWTAPEEDALLPEEFTPRAGHSAYLDENNKLWIVGGYSAQAKVVTDPDTGEDETVEETTPLNDVWSGKLNKL
ncbi:MAG: DUF6242 domain-containing protein [Bacteroidales bacterium]|nr:DUF6242 domain-containing protein [Bacteroidales bacterium]